VKVLVTGGAGYVGSVVAARLLDAGHEVRCFDSLTHGGTSLLGLYPREGFEFVRGDIRCREKVDRALIGVDAVVHLAAIVGDPACKIDPELSVAVNQTASLQLFDLARDREIPRLVFASTCSNYGRMAGTADYVDENTELRPASVYAETKVAVEQALLAKASDEWPAATVLRLATVYGLSPRPRFDLTVNEFTAQLYLKRRLVVFGEQFWRPYVHVRDAADAVRLVLDRPAAETDGQVFNVGSTAENYRKGELVELVVEQVGEDTVVERVEQSDDPRDYRVSFERIRGALGFQPTRTVRDGIREVLDALRSGIIVDFEDPVYRN
jgi:nucleoside-diphosphate-sugar epimerase